MTYEKIIDQLKNIEIVPDNSNADGRVNSLTDEENIIKLLKSIAGDENITEPPPRWWYDVKVCGVPVQIKSSTGQADNFSSKKGILYALTTLSEEEIDSMKNISWAYFDELMLSSLSNDPRDYNIIVLDKKNKKCHHKTLLTLNKLTSNGSNLPFQVPWKHNWTEGPVQRNCQEARRFIISCYAESVQKKLNQHRNYELLKENYNWIKNIQERN